MDADLVKTALTHTARLTNSLAKSQEKNGDKSAMAMLKSGRQSGCVFQDMAPPKSSSILREETEANPMCSIHYSHVTSSLHSRPKSIARKDFPSDPHQRNPNSPKFEDRSQEKAEWQERCAREAAWRLAKHILKKGETQNRILLTCVKLVSTYTINP